VKVDAFEIPDGIINSPLGYFDGQIYGHIFDSVTNNPSSFSRPEWWHLFKEPLLL